MLKEKLSIISFGSRFVVFRQVEWNRMLSNFMFGYRLFFNIHEGSVCESVLQLLLVGRFSRKFIVWT